MRALGAARAHVLLVRAPEPPRPVAASPAYSIHLPWFCPVAPNLTQSSLELHSAGVRSVVAASLRLQRARVMAGAAQTTAARQLAPGSGRPHPLPRHAPLGVDTSPAEQERCVGVLIPAAVELILRHRREPASPRLYKHP